MNRIQEQETGFRPIFEKLEDPVFLLQEAKLRSQKRETLRKGAGCPGNICYAPAEVERRSGGAGVYLRRQVRNKLTAKKRIGNESFFV